MELDGPPPSFEDIDSTQPMPLPPAYTENHVASPSISHELLSQQMTGTSSITNGANISLVIWYGPAPFLIPVNKATATVGFLKTLVERKAGVLASKQILKTLRGQFLTPDSKLLSDFNVEAEPDIQLEETQTHNGNALVSSIRVRLLSRGSSVFHVDIDLDLRVESLKAKIEQKVNIAPSSQKLVFKGSILQNERTLTSYGIQSQSELFLFLLTKDTSQISVLHYGDMYKVDSYDVRPLDKLSYLKAKIAEADGYGNFTIWFKGKPLTDDKEIASYGIIDGSKVLVR